MNRLALARWLTAIFTTMSFAALVGACKASVAKREGSAADGAAACPDVDASDARAAWSARFPVERGGVVVLLGNSLPAVEAEIRQWQSSSGLVGLEMSYCGSASAVWIPGVACPAEALGQALARVALVRVSHCFAPLPAADIVEACERAALSPRSCASEIPPMAEACRPKASARCQQLARLAARYAVEAR